MVVRGIAAFDCNYAMGYKGGLPWPPIPEDMAEFRRLTLHKPVIMGRRTWESIGGRPLDHRVNVVVSSTLEFRYPNQTPPGVVVIRDGGLQGALEYLRNAEEAWVIGGARMYEEAAPLMSEFWTTYIAEPHPFDVRFPWQILLGFKVAATKRLAPKIYQERRIPRI